MQVGLDDLTYVPTLHMRPAELSALEHLSDTDKDAIVPIILLKPWGNSKTIEKAIDKIEAIYSGRSYFMQCDPAYPRTEQPENAAKQFAALCDETDDYGAWWKLVETRPHLVPAVPLSNDPAQLTHWVQLASGFGRGFMIRILRSDGQQLAPLVSALSTIEHNGYVVCLDVGWGRDILSSELWADGWIKGLVAANEQVKIIVAGSSFPREFSRYGTYGEEVSLERALYANLVKKNNQARLVYGDWGSARPSVGQGGGILIRRIDVPKARSWIFFRAKDGAGSYKQVATTAIESKKWEFEPDVWGKYIIRNTSLGQGYVIDSPKKSTEARINIHMHQQIDGAAGGGAQYVEEDYKD